METYDCNVFIFGSLLDKDDTDYTHLGIAIKLNDECTVYDNDIYTPSSSAQYRSILRRLNKDGINHYVYYKKNQKSMNFPDGMCVAFVLTVAKRLCELLMVRGGKVTFNIIEKMINHVNSDIDEIK